MKTIRLKFVKFGNPQMIQDFRDIVSRHFQICECDDPDYLVAGSYGDHFNYDQCIKIQVHNENSVCDFNAFDYAVGFDHLEFGDRYLRVPFSARANRYKDLIGRHMMAPEQLLNRKFCSFVVSNVTFGDPMRKLFFDRLSKYKRVDSGGRWMNNVGGPVKDKLEFCRGYKFNIAFENSSSPGYVTEKIMEAYAAQTVPIYYGDPTVETDFRPESMVRVRDEADVERAVEEIIRLDRDDAAYLRKVKEPCLAYDDPKKYERELESFLFHIFDQPLHEARRRCFYGHQQMMREHMRKLMKLDQWIGKARQVLHV